MSTHAVPTVNRCIACLREMNASTRCPHCGYDEHHYKAHPLYLKPRTWLDNHYLVGRALGQGGFGVTYVGWDKWLQRQVAIKEFLPAALATRDVRHATVLPLKQQEAAFARGLDSFIDEAQHLARFNHPHIVRVSHFFQANATAYMVMDYLHGETLERHLEQQGGRLSVTQALAIILPILDALDAVHRVQLYHRDISAQNVFMLKNKKPVLIDFGAARYNLSGDTQSLDMVLKHGYSPLEQYSGRGNIGPWTDIYACGALLYRLLSGCLPPAATDRFADAELCDLHVEYGVPEHMQHAIDTALAIKPHARFQQVNEFKAALCGETIVVPTPPHSQIPPLLRPTRAKWLARMLNIFTALVALLLLLTPNDYALTPLFNAAKVQFQSYRLDDNEATLQRVTHFHQQAQTAYQADDWHQALQLIQRGLRLQPDNAALLTLQTTIQNQLLAKETVTVSEKSTEKISLDQRLAATAQQVKAKQFAAAYDSYQALLKQYPNQPQIKQGQEDLVLAYVHFIQRPQTDLATQLAMTEEGLKYFPHHTALHDLHQRLFAQQQRQHDISTLLQQAETHMAAQHWVIPTGDNAYQIYQRVLQLDADNAAAQAGIQRIVQQLLTTARTACEQQNWQRCAQYADQGLHVEAQHSALQALQQQAKQAIHATQQQQQHLTALLKTAQQQWQAGQQEAAIQTYRQVIASQPKHEKAQQALADIAQWWVTQTQTQTELKTRLQWIKRGLRWFPQHAALLQQQRQTQQALQTVLPSMQPTKQNSKMIFAPSF